MAIRPASVAIALWLGLVLAPRLAAADRSPSAAQLRKDGVALYQSKQYRPAAIKFAAAYELEPDRDTLFAWAQAERLGGNCARAVELYEKFLDMSPSTRQRDAANTLLDMCRAELTAARNAEQRDASGRKPPEDEDDDDGGEPVGQPLIERAPAEPRSWTGDWLGHSVTGAGAIGLGVGAGFLVSAYSKQDAADDADSYEVYAATIEDARLHRTIGAVSGSVGVVLVGLGIWHYISYSGEPDPESAGLSAWAADGAYGAAWSTQF